MQHLRDALIQAVHQDKDAAETFTWMNEAIQMEFLAWIKAAQDENERLARLRESVDILAGREPFRRH